jgi:hypothetical protein
MHRSSLSILFACVSIVLAQSDEYSPFFDPIQYSGRQPLILRKRQNCPTGYNNCGSLGSGADSACCPTDQNCAVDAVGHVACCPSYAVCTGTIAGTLTVSATTTTTSTPVYGGTTTTASFNTASSITSGVAGGGSTVPNTYYPFVYIPTSYANAALCSSAWTSCQAESTACFQSLAGTNGVTVSGVAGGTTQIGISATVAIQASSICSSLSASACRGLQTQQCAGGNANAGGPRPTPCPGMVYAIGAGAVVGAAGALMP